MSPKKAGIAGPVLAAVCIAIIPLTGCSPAEQAPEETPKAAETRTTRPPIPEPSKSAVTYVPQSSAVGDVLTQLDDQSGIGHINGVHPDSDALAVFSSCEGSGTISVEITGLASYTHNCGSSLDLNSSGGHFDIRRIDGALDVTVTPSGDQRWALEVREAGLMTPAPGTAP